jgi:hypothetical protein
MSMSLLAVIVAIGGVIGMKVVFLLHFRCQRSILDWTTASSIGLPRQRRFSFIHLSIESLLGLIGDYSGCWYVAYKTNLEQLSYKCN